MKAKESRESVLMASSLKYKLQEQEAAHNGSRIHLTPIAIYEASTQDFVYLSDEVVDVTSSLAGPAELSILSTEPFSQFSVILFQVNTNGVRSDGNTCELDSLQCLSMISIQLQSDSLADFEWPQVPLDVLIGKDMEPLPSGWYQISFEVSPYGNIWGNSTFTSFSLVDTQGMLDSFQVRDIGISSTEIRLPEGLPGAMMEVRAGPLSFVDRLCGIFNFFFCEQEVDPPLPGKPEAQPPSLDPPLPPVELLPSLESPGPFNVIQLRRNKKGKPFVFYLPIGPFSNENSSVDSFSALIFGHGLGATVNLYSQMLRNIASHGFLICGPDTPNLFNGKDMVGCVSLLEEENTNPSSPIYGRIKNGPFGFFGHSMGGRGAAAAAVLVGKTSGAVVSMQPAPFYDASKIGCPIFLSAGNLDIITPPVSIRSSIYRGSNPPKMMATMAGIGHLNPVNFVGGQQFTSYAIGWFKLYLENEYRFDPLFWDASASGSIINDARMSSVDYVK